MSVLFLLIPLSIVLAVCFLAAFIWAMKSGQYEDTFTPSMRVLLDETQSRPADCKGPLRKVEPESEHSQPCPGLSPDHRSGEVFGQTMAIDG